MPNRFDPQIQGVAYLEGHQRTYTAGTGTTLLSLATAYSRGFDTTNMYLHCWFEVPSHVGVGSTFQLDCELYSDAGTTTLSLLCLPGLAGSYHVQGQALTVATYATLLYRIASTGAGGSWVAASINPMRLQPGLKYLIFIHGGTSGNIGVRNLTIKGTATTDETFQSWTARTAV